MKRSKFYGLLGSGVAVALAVGIPLAHSLGVRLNFTHSAPSGLYLVNDNTPQRGDMVEVCPPNVPVIQLMNARGYMLKGLWGNCEKTNVSPLLKPISAVVGDIVEIEPNQRVKVNGIPLPNTQPLAAVPQFPPGIYEVKLGEYWVFSTYNKGSIDSRYFGPVSLSNINGQAKPIFIKGDISKVFMGVTKQ